jgi:hypothetical protein
LAAPTKRSRGQAAFRVALPDHPQFFDALIERKDRLPVVPKRIGHFGGAVGAEPSLHRAPLIKARRLGRSGVTGRPVNGLRRVDTVAPNAEERQHLFVNGSPALEEPGTAGQLTLVLALLRVSS